MAEPTRGPRIAVVAALPFPLALGSQIFVRDQLRALAGAGGEATLLCYASHDAAAPPDLDVIRAPSLLASTPLRAGPNFAKPVADAALIAIYLAAHRRRRFDVALAHNGEGALAALAARRLTGVPVFYVAHALLGRELPTWGPPPLRRALAALGSGLDRWIAGASDGVLALCEATAHELAGAAAGPVEVIPPGLDPAPPPTVAARRQACARHGLRPGAFALYSGNLDGYQDMGFLAAAATQVPDLPVVVATHAIDRPVPAPLRSLRVRSYAEMRALVFAAAIAVLPRRSPGGFPIKLLGYMEAARPIVAIRGVADGLVDGLSAALLAPDAEPGAFAAAVRALAGDPARAARLGAGARATLGARHDWRVLARRTLALLAQGRATSLAA